MPGPDTITYAPLPPWQPPHLDLDLHGNVVEFQTDPNLASEQILAESLARASGRHIPEATTTNGVAYRASRAVKEQAGNCMAHAEAAATIGIAHGLDMLVGWNINSVGGHAFALWLGATALWKIDGFMITAHEAAPMPLDDYTPYQQTYLTLGKQVSTLERPMHQQTLLWGDPKPNWVPTQDLRNHDGPKITHRERFIFPALQGIAFLGALGDFKRYQADESPEATAKLAAWKASASAFVPQAMVDFLLK